MFGHSGYTFSIIRNINNRRYLRSVNRLFPSTIITENNILLKRVYPAKILNFRKIWQSIILTLWRLSPGKVLIHARYPTVNSKITYDGHKNLLVKQNLFDPLPCAYWEKMADRDDKITRKNEKEHQLPHLPNLQRKKRNIQKSKWRREISVYCWNDRCWMHIMLPVGFYIHLPAFNDEANLDTILSRSAGLYFDQLGWINRMLLVTYDRFRFELSRWNV